MKGERNYAMHTDSAITLGFHIKVHRRGAGEMASVTL
jgi:hypothetical protein